MPDEMREFLASSQEIGAQVENRELYSFTDRALRAASDLHVDTPERMERLVSAVTGAAGRLLIEARSSELVGILSNIRGFISQDLQDSLSGEERSGFLVDMMGEGRFRFLPILLLPEKTATPVVPDTLRRSLPASLREALDLRSRVLLGTAFHTLDIRRHVGLSRHEFDQLLERGGRGDPFLDAARQGIASGSGIRDRDRIAADWWRMVRLRDLVERETDFRISSSIEKACLADQDPQLMDPVRTGLHLIALLAVLTAEAREIGFYPRGQEPEAGRNRSPTPASGSSAQGGRRPQEPGQFRIVSLNVDLEPRHGDPGSASSGQGEAHLRARHPVRGHLFLARNGRLVWRKPHWRGSLEQAVIHRVTAKA